MYSIYVLKIEHNYLFAFFSVPGCGGDFGAVATTQVVTSPGYPFGYNNNLDCTWSLHSLPGFRIWVNISDIDIETHGTCLYDKLVIYDGKCRICLARTKID